MTTLPFTIPATALGNYADNTGTGNINCSCEYFNNFKSPNVLQNNLGMHLLNEGQIKMNCKVWKYVIDPDNHSLSFLTSVILPQPSSSSTSNFTANVCLFNTNNSSITLTPSQQTPGQWVLVSSTGNNGFNTI